MIQVADGTVIGGILELVMLSITFWYPDVTVWVFVGSVAKHIELQNSCPLDILGINEMHIKNRDVISVTMTNC